MRLHEYQSKRQLQKYQIPVAIGQLALTPDEVYAVAKEINQPVVIKAQVLTSDRTKSIGIDHANTPEEAREKARAMFARTVQGLEVKRVLVDPEVRIQREIYLGITYDRSVGYLVLVASTEGGVDVEEVARRAPHNIIREYIKPILGLRSYQITAIASTLEIPRHLWEDFRQITHGLYECYTQSDALLAEINPLVITDEEKLTAIDATLIIDDNALYRQPELALMRENDVAHMSHDFDGAEVFSYIKLNGQIGCMVNGAGLAMTTMDMISDYGGGVIRPANFMDIGGGASAERVAAGLRLILMDHQVEVILLNIFGGLTRCDEVAHGILEVYQDFAPTVPIIVRLQGTNAREGLSIINQAGLPHLYTAQNLTEAAIKAIEIVGSDQWQS